MMNLSEFTKLLDKREYPRYSLLTTEERNIAKEHGYVVVYGHSDDLMEFEGAIDDEGVCFGGGEVYFDRDGVSYSYEDKSYKKNIIKALWCKEEDYTWSYKTSIPHECFDILDDGNIYCRGIVFSINDIL